MAYAQRSGISLSAGNASGGGGPVGGATINSEEFLKFQAEQVQFTAQAYGIVYALPQKGLGVIKFFRQRKDSFGNTAGKT